MTDIRWQDNKIHLTWHGATPPNILDIEQIVMEDLPESLWGLDCPSDLIFHTVFLSNNMDGEHVIVWGLLDDEINFHCQWYK